MDYISRLPEAIIHNHILSQLSTREVAQTSALSKTWKLLWSTFPYLEFQQYHFDEAHVFRKYVDQTLRDRQKSKSDILKFKLGVTPGSGIEDSDIDNWIILVIERNVKEFDLRFLGGKPYIWPPKNMCIAMTITVLKLSCCDVKFYSIIKLPHLQILSLEGVFLDERSIGVFFNGCPSMNDLKIWYCHGLEHLNIANLHQLKRAVVGYCPKLEKVEIRASLQTLQLFDNKYKLTSPLVLNIDLGAYGILRELHLSNLCLKDGTFTDLICGLSNLECLTLDNVLKPQSIRIVSEKLKRLVLEYCNFLTADIRAPQLNSLEYYCNRKFYPLETHNVQVFKFLSSQGCFTTTPDQQRLWFESVKEFLMNSSGLGKGTRMILFLKWPNYAYVLEDWTVITQLPYEAVRSLFPKEIHISNVSSTDLAEYLRCLYILGKRLLVISYSDSKFYEVLKEKLNCQVKSSSTFTLTKEVYERNTIPERWSPDSMDKFSSENFCKCPFFAALVEVSLRTKQISALELQ